MSEGAKTKLLNYFLKNVGREVPRLELVQLCRNNGDWTRSLRSLRDLGWIVIYNRSNKTYCFPYSEPRGEPRDRRYIPKDVRARVEIRDVSTCQMCGRSVRNDGITIHIDHIVPLSWGGGTVVDNLQCLCRECNEGKKNWVANESPDLMKEISQATNTIDRLRLYFILYYKMLEKGISAESIKRLAHPTGDIAAGNSFPYRCLEYRNHKIGYINDEKPHFVVKDSQEVIVEKSEDSILDYVLSL